MPRTVYSLPSPSFVGRAREVEELAGLLGAGPAVLVTGPFGIGKTALVAAVIERELNEGRIPRPGWTSVAGARDESALYQRSASALGFPGQVEDTPGALAGLLGDDPRTLVWDDAQEAALGPLLRSLEALLSCQAVARASRVVVVAREDGSAGDLRRHFQSRTWPCFQVPALDPEASVRLLQALEHERGRTVYEAIAGHAGGNPLGLQLSLLELERGELDPAQRARRTLDALGAAARALLALLVAAEVPIPLTLVEPELARLAVPSLAQHGLVRLEEGRVVLSRGTAQAFRWLLGETDEATVRTLAELGERLLVAAPGDPDVLRLACRALVRRGRTQYAALLLRHHALARGRLPARALLALLQEIAAGDAGCALECQLLLAEEELHACDFAAAERTLAAIPTRGQRREQVVRALALRARTLVRAGNPTGSSDALRQVRVLARSGGAEEAELAAVEHALLRGALGEARRLLRGLGRTGPMRQEGDRALLLAISYLLEGRIRRSETFARHAHREYRRRNLPVDPLLRIVEVLALLAQDQLAAADSMVARAVAEESEARGGRASGVTPLLQALLLCASGALLEARRHGERALLMFERRSDRFLLPLGAHVLFRCALGQGALDRAESLLRGNLIATDDPEMAVLRPFAELEAALLHAARGERSAAAEHARGALSAGLRLPQVRVEAWALSSDPDPPPSIAGPAAAAYCALRTAERALDGGGLDEADKQAAFAERWYGDAGMRHHLARAQLARAEALARASRRDEARTVLGEVFGNARRGPYAALLTGANLVRAYLAERDGDRNGTREAIAAALAAAGTELLDPALLDAAARAGLPPAASVPARGRPWQAMVERLGLARPVQARYDLGSRSWLLAEEEPWPAPAHLVVRIDRGDVWSSAGTRTLPGQGLQLLASIARAGQAGITLEDVHTLRGGHDYHPLRHRNAIYVALARLRESLAELISSDELASSGELVEVVEGRCRMAPALQVAVLTSARGGSEARPG